MSAVDRKSIGRRVRQARKRLGLTQAALAEAAGLSDETVSRIERGTYEPALSTVVALAQAMELSLDFAHPMPQSPESGGSLSPLLRELMTRAGRLDSDAQRALLELAELLGTRPRGWSQPGRKRSS